MSSIVYDGRVSLVRSYRGRYRDTRVIHNNGTYLLFKQLCQGLAGYSISLTPKYLDIALGEGSGEKLSFTSRLVGGEPLVGRLTLNLDEGSNPSLRLYFKLAYASVQDRANTGTTYLVVRGDATPKTSPYSISDGSVLMYLDIGSVQFAEGEAHEIFWTLQFQNPAEEAAASAYSSSDSQEGSEVI